MSQVSTKNLNQPASRRSRSMDLSTMVYGKVPPQALEMEEAVLGAILIESRAMDAVCELIHKPECFYAHAHIGIFKAMLSLHQRSQKIDILTVVEELKRTDELENVGGPYYITKLTNHVVSSANVEEHAKVIMERFLKREVIRISGEMLQEAYEHSTDIFELIDNVESQVLAITLSNIHKDFRGIDTGLVKVVQRLEQLRHKDDAFTGVPSGFRQLDQITYGWQNTDLIILAARPSVGKTAFALNLARNAALHPHKPTPVGIFSMEMSEEQLIQRILSAESEIWLEKIARGRMEDEEMKQLYTKGIQRIAQAPLFIDDTAGINIFELRAKARRMKMKHGVGLIIIDYLQLMSGDTNDSKNREREIAKISRELKKLAKDLEVPIIALSQLSREVEKRGKGMKVPQLSDLRESGAIEQDADLVMFLYRPPDDEVKEDAALKNRGMVKIAKNRHGKLDEVVFKFFGEVQRWTELAQSEQLELNINKWKPLPANTIPRSPVTDYTQPRGKDNDEDDLPF